jgi:hypothetical protein
VKGVVPPARLNAEQGRAFCVAHLLILSNDLAHRGNPCEMMIVDSCIKPQKPLVNKIISRFTFFTSISGGRVASDSFHGENTFNFNNMRDRIGFQTSANIKV